MKPRITWSNVVKLWVCKIDNDVRRIYGYGKTVDSAYKNWKSLHDIASMKTKDELFAKEFDIVKQLRKSQ